MKYNRTDSDFDYINTICHIETKEEVSKYSSRYGHEHVVLTKKDIEHLLKGGILAWNDGEYTHSLHYFPDGEE